MRFAVRAWSGERPDPAVFDAEILPGLREVSIGALAAATGVGETRSSGSLEGVWCEARTRCVGSRLPRGRGFTQWAHPPSVARRDLRGGLIHEYEIAA
jgi:hypothetical protein